MKIKHIIMFLVALIASYGALHAQGTLSASGTVMDEKGELLIGVTISVKENPSLGAITDVDGHFKLGGIKSGQTLQVSYIGYETQTFKITKI